MPYDNDPGLTFYNNMVGEEMAKKIYNCHDASDYDWALEAIERDVWPVQHGGGWITDKATAMQMVEAYERQQGDSEPCDAI